MIRTFVCLLASMAMVSASALGAEPTKLKLSFFSSDRSTSYFAAVKPFMDAVNSEAKGMVEIELFASGALGRDLLQQPQLVLDGTADIAYVVPGLTRELFPDNAVVELPGLFNNMREATLVFTRLVAANALKGYENYFVVGAYVTEPETVHSRTPIRSLADLKGKRIRANNPGQTAALSKLDALPILMPVNKIAEALGGGALDAAVVSTSPLHDFGIRRVANYHYLLPTSGAPLMVLMSRKVFENLPPSARDVIRKFSGVWAAERFIETFDKAERAIMVELRADAKQHVLEPTASDLDRAKVVFKTVREDWVADNPHNSALLDIAMKELAAVRGVSER